MFYVYEWFIKETGEVIYTGKGSGNRYKAKKRNQKLNHLIERIPCDVKIIKYFENEKDAFDYERTRIDELKEIGQCICNNMRGGTGGYKDSWNDNRREWMSVHNGMKNKEVSQRVAETRKRPIVLNGIRYKSQVDAAKELGVATNTVRTWLKEAHDGNGNPCRYEDEKQRPYNFIQKVTNSRIVIVDDLEFNSVRAAAKYIGCWPETVINCIKKNRLCNGHKCEYGNQHPSRMNSNNSSAEGSEANG